MTNPTKGGMPKMMRWIRAAIAACAFGALVSLPLYAADQAADGQRFGPLGSGTGAQVSSKVPVPQLMGGMYAADTTSRALRTDASGNVLMADADRDRDLWQPYSLINNYLFASGNYMADSNAVPMDTHNFRRCALVIYGNGDSLSSRVRIAVQVRAHYTSAADSGSTYPWYRWRPGATGSADGDSLGHFLSGSTTLAQTTSGTGLWSSEFMVEFDVAGRSAVGGFGANPIGMYVPLVDAGGAYFWAPYTSVRVRVINGIKSRFKIRVDLVGSAL